MDCFDSDGSDISEPSILAYSGSDDYQPSDVDGSSSDDSRHGEPQVNASGGEINRPTEELPNEEGARKRSRKRQKHESKLQARKRKSNSGMAYRTKKDFMMPTPNAEYVREYQFFTNDKEVSLLTRLLCARTSCFLNYLIAQRYVLGCMGFFALANGYIQRFCLSLAITEMVATHRLHPTKIDPYACPLDSVIVTNGTVHSASGEFVWDESTQGLILSAFFWGYVIMQLPGGLLAERYGGKYTLGLGMLTSTLCTLATPFVARTWGAIGLIIVRFIIGLGQGPLYPSLNVLLAFWAPNQERGRLGAIVFAGAQIGNVVSMALSGYLIYLGSWTLVFYTFGGLGLIWAVCWCWLCYSAPSEHPRISAAEHEYIRRNSARSKLKEMPPTPWGSIAVSVPFWALVIAQIGHDWGLFTIITDLPKYMKSVMHFSITQNGLLSAAPYLVMWFVAIASGWIVDWLVGPKGVNITIVRKIFVSIASLGPAVGILSASYAGCDKVLVAIFFTLGMGMMGSFVPSLKVNALDLSPNYAGTLMALVGGIGAISGIITPYLVGLLTPNSTLLEWRLVFWIAVIVLLSTNFVYIMFGSGETQPWNEPETTVEEKQPEEVVKNDVTF